MTRSKQFGSGRARAIVRSDHDPEVRPMSEMDETGAIDWLLIEAPGHEFNGQLVPPLLDLVDQRLIRVLDALVLIKRAEGDFDALTTDELGATDIGEIGELAGASSGLLDDEDAATRRGDAEPRQRRPADRLRESVVAAVRAGRSQTPVANSSPAATFPPRQSLQRSTLPNHDEGINTMGLIGGVARTRGDRGHRDQQWATVCRVDRRIGGRRRTSPPTPSRNRNRSTNRATANSSTRSHRPSTHRPSTRSRRSLNTRSHRSLSTRNRNTPNRHRHPHRHAAPDMLEQLRQLGGVPRSGHPHRAGVHRAEGPTPRHLRWPSRGRHGTVSRPTSVRPRSVKSQTGAMPGLTSDELQTFLDEPGHLLRLGTNGVDGLPRVVPIWFIHRDGAIWFTPPRTVGLARRSARRPLGVRDHRRDRIPDAQADRSWPGGDGARSGR